jgi:hypothetical protein
VYQKEAGNVSLKDTENGREGKQKRRGRRAKSKERKIFFFNSLSDK